MTINSIPSNIKEIPDFIQRVVFTVNRDLGPVGFGQGVLEIAEVVGLGGARGDVGVGEELFKKKRKGYYFLFSIKSRIK